MKIPNRLLRGFESTAVKSPSVSSLVSGLIVLGAVPTLVDAKLDALRASQFIAVGDKAQGGSKSCRVRAMRLPSCSLMPAARTAFG
jgi:hypothetical protein